MRSRRVRGRVTVGRDAVYAGDLVASTHGDGSICFTTRRPHLAPLGAVGHVKLDEGTAVRVFVGSTRVLAGYPGDPREAAPARG